MQVEVFLFSPESLLRRGQLAFALTPTSRHFIRSSFVSSSQLQISFYWLSHHSHFRHFLLILALNFHGSCNYRFIMLSSLFLSLLLSTASAADLYAPRKTTCPSTPLVRAASGLSDNEETYRVARKAVADQALKTWLTKTDPGFGTAELPTVHTPYRTFLYKS